MHNSIHHKIIKKSLTFGYENNKIYLLQTDNLQRLSRSKRDTFEDIIAAIKRGGKTAVEYDREVRQAVQNKAIQLLDDGTFDTVGKLAAPAAQKVKELWDRYDALKLRIFS